MQNCGIYTLRILPITELLSTALFSREFDLISLTETRLTSNGSSEIEVTYLDRIQRLVSTVGDAS